jgi:hypothetical protein
MGARIGIPVAAEEGAVPSKPMRRISICLRVFYGACLLGAGVVHLFTHFTYGPLLEGLQQYGYPAVTRMYWSLLTLLDFAVAGLLFLRPRLGVWLTVAIILSNVAHNSWLLHHLSHPTTWMYWAQLSFLVFVLATAKWALRTDRGGRPRDPVWAEAPSPGR